MDPLKNTALRQYATGVLNRRIAARVADLDRPFAELTGETGEATLLCACGREGGCQSPVTIPLPEFELVRASPHRFLIAPGHAQPVDEIVHEGNGYQIVQIKLAYRDAEPPTASI